MLFTELRFFGFFGLVLAIFWALRSHRQRKTWLLICSYAFYAGWDWRFLGLILFSTCVDYWVGVGLSGTSDERRRKRLLTVSVVANLGLLGFFKYFNFFVESAAGLLSSMGFEPHDMTLNILLPIGISFYTFQTMSYTIDVYRRNLEHTRSLLDFGLFVAFFPQLVAGPIVRAVDFIPQLKDNRSWQRDVAVRASLSLFLWGFIKKACVADHCAVVADQVFEHPELYSNFSTWIGLMLYHVQIYCDFSGYSDMAIACAGLLGYKLPENFRFPYFSRSLTEFWQRWHISLTGWLRDYLYYPLGGGRGSMGFKLRNLYVTMILCGMWHGAGWQYLGFGLQYATYLALELLWRSSRMRAGAAGRVTAFLGMPMCNLALFLGWPIFRGAGTEQMRTMYRNFFFQGPTGLEAIDSMWVLFFAGCVLVHWVFYKRLFHARLAGMSDALFALVYGLAWAMVLPWVATGQTPFIYFQF